MYESSTKETKWVCIQLAFSRRPRAFEEAHCWNIQAKFYNEKFPLVYESDKKKRLSIIKIMVLLWSTSMEKIVALPLFLGLSFFLLAVLFFLGQCSMNDDHHTSIYLQLKDYNSILEQNMTLYECLRRCTGMGNETRVTCMKLCMVALPQIRCQLHDHARKYDNDEACHDKRNDGKLYGNISRLFWGRYKEVYVW